MCKIVPPSLHGVYYWSERMRSRYRPITHTSECSPVPAIRLNLFWVEIFYSSREKNYFVKPVRGGLAGPPRPERVKGPTHKILASFL